MTARKRQNDFHVYLDDYEYSILEKLCSAAKCDRSKMIRMLIKGVKIVEAPPVDYKNFIFELRKLGTNLNQLTAKANSLNFIDREECREVLTKIRRLEKTITDFFKPKKGGFE